MNHTIVALMERTGVVGEGTGAFYSTDFLGTMFLCSEYQLKENQYITVVKNDSVDCVSCIMIDILDE